MPRSATPRVDAGRSLTRAQWHFVRARLDALPAGGPSVDRRLTVALELLYATGLRLSEAVAARADDLQRVEFPPDRDDDRPLEGWMLTVVGKGMRQREVPVPAALVARLGAYLASRGLAAEIEGAGQPRRLPARPGQRPRAARAAARPRRRRRQGRHRLQHALRPGQALLRRLRRRAAGAGRPARRRPLRARQHALAAPHPRLALDRRRHAGRDRPAEPRPRLARHHHRLRQHREEAQDAGDGGVLGEGLTGPRRPPPHAAPP